MDLSGNSLTNELPASMSSLSSLTVLRLQNNQLTGVLDVLQDLPLTDLNIENNLFSGPIPPKLLNIPDFRRGGNPFNTTVIASPPASSPPSLTPSEAPSSQYVPQVPVHGPPAVITVSPPQESGDSRNTRLTWITIGALSAFVFIVLALCVSKCCKKRRISENHTAGTHKRNKSWQNPFIQDHQGVNQAKTGFLKKDHSIDIAGSDDKDLSRGPLPLPLLRAERVVADPTFASMTMRENASKIVESAKMFTIASLQQCTNSFSQENFIGKGTLGSVYRAQLPDGKVLAVKKLDKLASGHLTDGEFLEMVSRISKLRHANIVELVGYCLEHGQRLLVYNYCRNGTLDEALNFDDAINRKLSWSARMRLALQAAKALEYLHEVCKPAVVHHNLKSCNVLLEDDLSVRVSDCGLAPLLSTSSMAQLQGSGYGAPELEFGSYSHQSDVYSFGVVLLRLLTGRKSYDRSRPRGEQFLARWAFSRLHDIDALSRMMDPTLNGAYPSMSLSRVADIISLCIQPEPEFRPPMSEIVQKLLRIIQT
ncbi:protein strubbelig-receptor family 1 [Phtheirospermum japonicum]|uniref:Protein strubbelig-receptor family 1 n=1 Tax=Phtheirospermum japonicum TaxID=374723 RepID=A0A830CGR2_9LAMI|nr:protein strubbelig-receptor family 1 [Phtheirospermum japonicum]